MKDMNEIEGDLLVLDGAEKLSDARIARIAKFDEKLSQQEKKKPLSPRERKEGQLRPYPKRHLPAPQSSGPGRLYSNLHTSPSSFCLSLLQRISLPALLNLAVSSSHLDSKSNLVFAQ